MFLSKRPSSLAITDVLILCGGLGTRLQPVLADRPKGLAIVGGKAFMDILIEDLVLQGFRRIILCVGHLKEKFFVHYGNRDDAEFLFSSEDVPLGTGGAVRKALPLVHSNPYLVMNGDSLCHVDFAKFHEFHQSKTAAMSMVVTTTTIDGRDGGTVRLDETQRVLSFMEKTEPQNEAHFISAGVYLMQRESIEWQQMHSPFSLEYDVFPGIVNAKPCFGFLVKSQLLDIGTPERYQKANERYR